MIYISTSADIQRPSFWLALEEWVAQKGFHDDCFFLWRTFPAAIFGRNQLIENEIDINFCRSHGIGIYRRKSGGGCIYSDGGNIMFSMITRDAFVGVAYNKFVSHVVMMLNKLGVAASASGRNDIMVDGKKIAGTAYLGVTAKNGERRSIVHSTMLYDTTMSNMTGALRPSSDKLSSKGVASVRQRIGLLKDYLGMSMETFMSEARRLLCHGEYVLNAEELTEVAELEQCYLSEDFLFGKNPHYQLNRRSRIEGVGEVAISLDMKNNVVKDVSLTGDFFACGDLEKDVIQPLRGVRLEREELLSALPDNLSETITGLTKGDFVDLMLKDD